MPQPTVNGTVLSYEDEGTGTPVVFLHGVWMRGGSSRAAVDVPSLVSTGRDDKRVPLSAAELVASSMPRVELVVLDESGHCPSLEETERFNDLVARFVDAQS